MPTYQYDNKIQSINEIIYAFRDYLINLPEVGEEFDVTFKFCITMLDYTKLLIDDLYSTRKELKSWNSYTKEDTYKTNLTKYLYLLDKTNANKNQEVLHEMIAKVDKLFMRCLATIVYNKKIKWYECDFESLRLNYVGESSYKGKTNITEKYNYNMFCNVSRFGGQKVLIAGGQYSHSFKKVAYAQILENDQIEREVSEKLPVERCKHAMVTVDNYIYLAGGTNDRIDTLNDFYKFDMGSLKWEELEKMIHKRESFFMCEYRSKFIITAGGFDGLQYLDSFELYNIRLNKWTYLNLKLPQTPLFQKGMERVGLAVNTLENKDELYVFGGSYDYGGGTKYHTQIWKVNMSKVKPIQHENNSEYTELEFSGMQLPTGDIRMFDKIGSKCILLLVDHPQNDEKPSYKHIVEVDFDDEPLVTRKLNIHNKETQEHLITDNHNVLTKNEIDIYCGCLTY